MLSQIYSGGRLGRRDFFAVELFDAVPYLVVDFGDRVHRFMLGRDARQVSDGSSHLVKVERSRKTLTLHLDKDEKSVSIVSAYTSLDLGITQSFDSRCDVLSWSHLCFEICGPRRLSPVYRKAVNFERFGIEVNK